ncbi:MAG: HEAT repeat domain-containing protein [Candidatus Gastranaerophilales bacterium]|nr:HEAT repeat domain-containing protein [Candidatus Gastranaerophilales bacterium]
MNKTLSKDIILYLENEFKNSKLDYTRFFNELKARYRALDIALIYNYILETSDNARLISLTIREINRNKYIQNFSALLDFMLKTNDIDLKVLAIKTIPVFKDKKAVPALLQCLKDKESNYKIRFAAADALGKIGDKNAFDALGYVVCDEDEKSAYVKESAVVALGNLGDKRALDVFSVIMSSNKMFLDKFSYLKERVVEAISKLDASKETKAIEILEKSLLEPSSRVRISAIEALMNLETPKSYELILDRLQYDDDLEVRKNALVALYNLSDREILDKVVLGDYPFELKEFAKDLIKEYEEENE